MKKYFFAALSIVGMIAIGAIASAQVSKVSADAEGITWTTCAAVMETALRRLDGVDKISISVPEQKFQVTFKPGAVFRPAEIRAAVGKAGVKVVGFHIDAKGRMAEEEGKRVFLAGKQKFLLSGDAKIFEGPVAVEGTVDDAVAPMKLNILKFKSLK